MISCRLATTSVVESPAPVAVNVPKCTSTVIEKALGGEDGEGGGGEGGGGEGLGGGGDGEGGCEGGVSPGQLQPEQSQPTLVR